MEDWLNNIELKSFWDRAVNPNKSAATSQNWDNEIKAINQCGKGLEETLRYLYQHQPSFQNFIEWIIPKENFDNTKPCDEDVLTQSDLNFFKQNGYVVLKNVVSQQQSNDAKNAIISFLNIDINDPSTWYRSHDEMRGLMLMFYHHPALQANRDSPQIKKAYQQLYASEDIHCIFEKVSFNPPETASYNFKGSGLHWDVSLHLPIPFKLQGLLYLSDVTLDGGAFNCVAGFHNHIEQWLNSFPENTDPRREAIDKLVPQAVPGNAGDFIIWHKALPHCATPNRSTSPRFVQYHTYEPNNVPDQEIWK